MMAVAEAREGGEAVSGMAVLARAWLASAIAVLCALAGHLMAGGSVTSWLGPLLAVALGAVAALPVVRRAPSLVRSLTLFVPAQLAYHLLFSALPAAHPGAALLGGDHAGHSMASMGQLPDGAAAHAPAHPGGTLASTAAHAAHAAHVAAPSGAAGATGRFGAHDGAWMLAFHLAAALLTAVVARWGEVCAARLGDALALAWGSALLVVHFAHRTAAPVLRLRDVVVPRPLSLRLVGRLRFRGPPSLA
jgi:hypothetical protein